VHLPFEGFAIGSRLSIEASRRRLFHPNEKIMMDGSRGRSPAVMTGISLVNEIPPGEPDLAGGKDSLFAFVEFDS
jgi:hypothetical protein